MNFWDTSVQLKPTGIKDPDATLDFPIDFGVWLADINDTLASFAVTTTGSITCTASTVSGTKVIPMIAGGIVGETASFTVRIYTAGGRIDDRTFYLKIVNR